MNEVRIALTIIGFREYLWRSVRGNRRSQDQEIASRQRTSSVGARNCRMVILRSA